MNTTLRPTEPVFRRALQPGQFQCVARGGIGDPGNTYPHALAWFRDYLYVGVARHAFQAGYIQPRVKENWYFTVSPVNLPKEDILEEFDCRAQIWRYHPPTNAWEKVYHSEFFPGTPRGDRLPAIGTFRNMIEFQSKDDARSALYMNTFSTRGGLGCRMVRTEDGDNFEIIPLLGLEESDYITFRPLVELKGKLYTAPTGKGFDANFSGASEIFESSDPLRVSWKQVNPDGFGDNGNSSVFELGVFNGHLYAGTGNSEGCQLWKTDCEGEPPYDWTLVFDRGGGRGPNNQIVGSMCAFQDALYVTAGVVDGGFDVRRGIGPASSEIIRVRPDDTWDIVVGEARNTVDGLKFPVSGLGPGFNIPFNGYIWRLCEYEGCLYAGTSNSLVSLQYLDQDLMPAHVRSMIDDDRVNLLIDLVAGCNLWRSIDGTIWKPVTINGFNNPYNFGVRTMKPTPYGLFVGCANAYAPDIAVKRTGGWQYEPNPDGGLELWLGRHDAAPPTRWATRGGITLDAPVDLSLAADHVDRRDPVENLKAAFYRGTGFRTIGLWGRTTGDGADAGRNLVLDLLSVAPGNPAAVLVADRPGGGAARVVGTRCPAADVANVVQPGPFPKVPRSSFDVILQADARFEDARTSRWLEWVRGALKSDGRYVASLLLPGTEGSALGPQRRRRGTAAGGVAELEDWFGRHGFDDVRVTDVTVNGWEAFRRHFDLFVQQYAPEAGADPDVVEQAQEELYGWAEPVRGYYIISAGSQPPATE